MSSLGPYVTAARMVRDYTELLYEPTGTQGDALAADGHRRARELAGWKSRVKAGWAGAHVDHLDLDASVAELGTERTAEVVVALGDLSPEDVEVQLIHGPAGQGEELVRSTVVPMRPSGAAEDDHLRYIGHFTCEDAGRYGVTVRIVPAHPDLVNPAELGLVAFGLKAAGST
jgi:starch phosphorylase